MTTFGCLYIFKDDTLCSHYSETLEPKIKQVLLLSLQIN